MSVTKAKAQSGEAVMLWIDDKVVALSTNCSINYTTNMVDASSKDDGAEDCQEPGTISWNGTNDFILTGDERTTDLNFDALLTKWKSRQKITITKGVPTGWDGKTLEAKDAAWAKPTSGVWSGQAYITNMSESHQKGQKSTGSLSFQGASEWKKA